MTLLRINYQLLRMPLQFVEHIAIRQLDEQAPARLAYEQLLIRCDRAAGYLLEDENAHGRAAALHRHTTAVRVGIARRHRRVDAESATLLDLQRARFHRRRQPRRNTDPA
ncbi:hypothetical protein OYT95_35120 [Rhodococcus sp. JS3073]|uniref:Uncharacterized protein n=2 Tax=Rhodococcus TaxID=1827 RepID=A0A076EI17_RHOOP|nr:MULTISPECIES: hypothetical protein [Rhodococcus]AII03179.1 hypothetical protein EP51_00205 [Rhodococcus opacus]WAM18869.1 hypothetical protein OYT95_35120 [Rhodococcus sp. JS3073]